MTVTKNILIVKYGALGDVVRTSFFAKPLRTKVGASVKLYWLTDPNSAPLLRFNPYIDVVTTGLDPIAGVEFDEIYSLDDEIEVLSQVARLRSRKLVGARLSSDGGKEYCEQSAYWFDMGLLSRHGKVRADELKKLNTRTHTEIFRDIFKVGSVDFNFYNSPLVESDIHAEMQRLSDGRVPIGLNAFAGKRWAAKGLPDEEFPKLAEALSRLVIFGKPVQLFLIGSGSDLARNKDYLLSKTAPVNITALNTDSNILDLAAVICSLKLLVTTDSLCLHLAMAQKIKTVAFFAPTSAAEIENCNYVKKLKSLSADYCNYRSDADNSTITSKRIIESVHELLSSGCDA